MATRRGNVLDPELTKLVQQVVRQFLNSFQPRPRAGKKRRGAGGSSGETRKARVTTTIPAATSTAAADWGLTGEAQLCDDTTGELTGDSFLVVNEWPKEFILDSQVELKMSHSPPRVLGGTCEALDPEDYWGDAP